jgi:rRNA maturation endonuclease Nob1
MSKHSVSEAFSAGLGLAMGVTMAQYLSQTMKPSDKMVKQVIICLKCGGKNPVENKFCGQCGQALYPPPSVQCPRCTAIMPSNIKFCGKCGFPLRKTEKIRKKRKSATS